ncbi:uncharacterized protein OCT59_004595 [Rhizophagus irregularis]|uniref:uncharacterized protein n=1 Tax=Rhizophagus irregularis TaxID=588596 RepID=UPI0019F82344|nr:hypothetical protein OCT59_004595 [Rhizophagus irregularis]GBC54490.2 kinase-like domain-containing protein [Rhizophagus irregularis DAOM 181602=DAOM 197198]
MWNWDHENNRWRRKPKTKVALKCLHNSKDITANFLKEVESNILVYNSSWIVRCFDPSKRPKADELQKLFYHELYYKFEYKGSRIYEQVGKVDEANKKSSFSVQPPISYTSHPKAVYTNRFLDFKNLPEPKNADNNDGIEYSDSLRIDFTINSKDEKNQPRFTLNEI